ncbi:SGNH/GDSL hydrolase family protein [Robertkochia solimangrovi]|nr:SGNH/GDSL hydrolase family protein [Robertkochia solimangrovi]
MYSLKRLPVLTIAMVILFICSNCTSEKAPKRNIWVGTWSTAPQLVEPQNNPPEPGLTGNTLRQIIRISIGGDTLRLHLSNAYSDRPLSIKKVTIAPSLNGSRIDTDALQVLQFSGQPNVVMNPGENIVSDALAFFVRSRSDLAITIEYAEAPEYITGHPGSRTTSWLARGEQSEVVEFEKPVTMDHWYTISGISVRAKPAAGAVAILGNSITDGRGSGTNAQNRWPDRMSEALMKDDSTSNIGVLNQGIGGNCVLRSCLGPSALSRYHRDVLEQPGVRWLILMEGINDIGQAEDARTADEIAKSLIDAYEQIITTAHQRKIKVFGATLLPFKDSFYYTDFREAARQHVNTWIRESGVFDGIIDFDSVMQDPNDPLRLLTEVHSGDWLHPNELGYKRMGEAVHPGLFK